MSGERIAHYQLAEALGEGGMGEVYLALDSKLRRQVAIKILSASLATDEEARQRFLVEARTASSLNHPHICTIHEVGETGDGRPYIVMEYLPGNTLSTLIESGPADVDQIVRVGLEVSDALALAHAAGIVHRDIKPSNIRLNERSQVKVIDFGIAKRLGPAPGESRQRTALGRVLGTPSYMSPEQALGRDLDPRSDLFSFGIVLYQLATSRLPFAGATEGETIDKIIHASPEPVSRLRPSVPPELERIIDRCLRQDPNQRYQSADELAADLTDFQRSRQSPFFRAPGKSVDGDPQRLRAFQEQHRTGLVTLLFAGIDKLSALRTELGDAECLELRRQHSRIMEELLAEFPSSDRIDRGAEGGFFVFIRPSDAVRFALKLQHRLKEYSRPPFAALPTRIGIHIGEVFIVEDTRSSKDLHGCQVEACSRLASLAAGSQILLSKPAFDNARQVLKGEEIEDCSELDWRSHGCYQIDGLEDPIEICEVGEAGIAPFAAPENSPAVRKTATADDQLILGWRPAVGQLVPGTEWRLEDHLGEGGFGEVWMALHQTLKQRRVFKFCFRGDRVRSLKREVTLFRLMHDRLGNHPNIVGIQEVFFAEPPYYIGMDYAKGRDLQSWLRARGGVAGVDLETRLEIVAQVADALQAAHDAGVVHRDVKPANILVDTGGPAIQVKLTDFGIGQIVSEETIAGLTQTGFTQTAMPSGPDMAGTQMYLAPELLAGKPASPRSDVYSLGVILFQLIVGDLNRPLTTDWSGVVDDELLKQDLERCFAGNPDERFAGAAELARHLRQLPQRRTAAEKERVREAAENRASYRRGLFRAITIATLVLAAFGFLAIYATHQASSARNNALELGRNLYAADLKLAREAYESGDVREAMSLLEKHHPRASDDDPRGFAWHYLRTLCVNGNALDTLRHHSSRVTSVDVSPQGILASASTDQKVGLVHLPSRRMVAYLQQDGPATAVAFSDSGERLATGTVRGTVALWNALTRQRLEMFSLDGAIHDLAFAPDGLSLAIAYEGGIVIHDVVDQRTVRTIPAAAWHLSFSPDGGTLLSTGSGLPVQVWNASSGAMLTSLEEPHDGYSIDVAFSPDGERFATCSWDTTIKLWNAKTMQLVSTFRGHRDRVRAIVFSSDGQWLASSSDDATVKLWHSGNALPLEAEAFTTLRGHTDNVESIAFSPDNQVIASGSKDGTVKLWPVGERSGLSRIIGNPYPIMRLTFLSEGKMLAGGDPDGHLHLWDLDSLHQTTISNAHRHNIFAVDASAELNALASCAGVWRVNSQRGFASPCQVNLWDLGTRTLLARLPGFTTGVRALAFAPDGTSLGTGDHNGEFKLWDLTNLRSTTEKAETLAPVWTLPRPGLETPNRDYKGQIQQIRFLPDGDRVVILHTGVSAEIWNVKTRQRELALDDPEHWSSALAVSRDGRLLAGGVNEVIVWNLPKGGISAVFRGHQSIIRCAAFSPDGTTLATGGMDSTVRLWNLRIMREVAILKGHQGPVSDVKFSPAGTILASTSEDKTIRLWQVTSPATLRADASVPPPPRSDP